MSPERRMSLSAILQPVLHPTPSPLDCEGASPWGEALVEALLTVMFCAQEVLFAKIAHPTIVDIPLHRKPGPARRNIAGVLLHRNCREHTERKSHGVKPLFA